VRGLAENFNLLLSGAKQPPPQWKTCVGATVNGAGLGFAITPAFVAARFPDGSVEKGKTLVEGIKAAFTKNLPDVPWLDEPTRKTAAFKAAAIKPFIGFPDFAGDGDQVGAITLARFFQSLLPLLPRFCQLLLTFAIVVLLVTFQTTSNRRKEGSGGLTPCVSKRQSNRIHAHSLFNHVLFSMSARTA
jgi:hypothetical protein